MPSILIGGDCDDGGGGFSMSASQCAAAKLRRRGGEPGAVLPHRLYVSVNSTFYIKMK